MTTRREQLAVALLLRHLEDRVDRFLLRAVDERAGVHDEHVSVLGVGRDLVSRLLGEAQHHLAVDEVLGAAERDKTNLQFTPTVTTDGFQVTKPETIRLEDPGLWARQSLRVQPIQHPRIRNGLAQMLQAADPADHPLDAHAEAAVRHGAEAAEVEIPLEGLLRQVVLLDALQQQVVDRRGARRRR